MKEDLKNRIYRSYVTNCFKAITSNTAKFGGGTSIKKSYDEIINNIEKVNMHGKSNTVDKSADQITADVIARGGLRLIDNTRKEEK